MPPPPLPDSIITKADMEWYEAKVKQPLEVYLTNGNLRTYSVPPPSSGIVYEFMLNVLDGKKYRLWEVTGQPCLLKRNLTVSYS